MTKEERDYMLAHPNEPMTPNVFSESIKLWRERGEPTKRKLREKDARENLKAQYQRNLIESDPYGMAGQNE